MYNVSSLSLVTMETGSREACSEITALSRGGPPYAAQGGTEGGTCGVLRSQYSRAVIGPATANRHSAFPVTPRYPKVIHLRRPNFAAWARRPEQSRGVGTGGGINMRVMIMSDMEGVSGIVAWEQVN